jgi:hypothetical protein
VFKLLLRYQSGLENSDEPVGGLSALCGGQGVDLQAAFVTPADVQPVHVGDGGPALASDAPSSTTVWKANPKRGGTSGSATARAVVGDLKASTVLHFMREIQREDEATIADALRFDLAVCLCVICIPGLRAGRASPQEAALRSNSRCVSHCPAVLPSSIISHFQLERPATAEEPLLTQSGFIAYLTSPANSAFAPELADRYQDMTQPLTSYYIDSSHNTYLVRPCCARDRTQYPRGCSSQSVFPPPPPSLPPVVPVRVQEGDQLSSYSSVNMYINVLTRWVVAQLQVSALLLAQPALPCLWFCASSLLAAVAAAASS